MRRLAAGLLAGVVVLSMAACQEDDPQPPADELIQYVALGDSHTAAPHTPTDDLSVPCFRSDNNYPHVLADLLSRTELIDVSCSGASTADMASEGLSRNIPVPPQLDALSEETDLVTINIGGNDDRLYGWLNCSQLTPSDPQGSPCADSNPPGVDVFLDKIPQIKDNVAEVIEQAKERAPNATIVVVTYPRAFPDRGPCQLEGTFKFAVGDQAYINTILETLGDAMIEAAKDAGVKWVDVYQASKGHDVCSKKPWINGSSIDQTRAMVLHPFPEEQAAIARMIMEQL